MRFKAKISKQNLLILHTLALSLEKIGSRAAIHLSPTALKVSVIIENIDAPRCYVEIPSAYLFSDYRIESQNENSILFEIGLDLFGWALASGKSSDFCQLKLVKRDSKPCLCLEAISSQGPTAVGVIHDIPIKLLPAGDILYYAPPDVPPPDTALQLPRGKLLRTIIERMVKFGKTMLITSSQLGQLTFRISQSTIAINTFVNNLVPVFTEGMDRGKDSNNAATVNIDIRKLACILALHHLPWDSAVIYMTHNATLFLELPLVGTGSIGFYIPILYLEQDV
jgi:hypothetical protein